MSDLVIVKQHEGVATVTLNRPEALNALSQAMRAAIHQTFTELQNDSSVQVAILTGAGRAFTVGLDLKELGGEVVAPSSGADPAQAITNQDISAALAAFDRPIIGAINGFAITGGFELALMCDFLIAAPEARFADTHARVGVVPGWGLSQRLPRLIGINRAKELSLTGNFLDATTAEAWGLVNRVVPAAELMSTCTQLARDIVSTEPVTRASIKRIMDAGWHTDLAQGLELELVASKAHAKEQKPNEQVAARRADIQTRGRNQQ